MAVPILRLGGILLVSIQEDLTDKDAIAFQKNLTGEFSRVEAEGVVLDVTGLDVIDSFMARLINDTATAIRLLGGEIVISGMQPAVAITLVEMGRGLIGVETALNLEQGLEKLRLMLARSSA